QDAPRARPTGLGPRRAGLVLPSGDRSSALAVAGAGADALRHGSIQEGPDASGVLLRRASSGLARSAASPLSGGGGRQAGGDGDRGRLEGTQADRPLGGGPRPRRRR